MTKLKLKKLQSELEWYKKYALYVAYASYNIDAEACSYADDDFEN